MGAAEETADFAALLRELKQRSGLSYEALAKRAHMSTSTLHRYCRGEGVPADYASLSRFARVCKATPEEVVELHRRWVIADAAREHARRTAAAVAAVQDRVPEPGSASAAPPAEPERAPETAAEPAAGPPAGPEPAFVPATEPVPGGLSEPGSELPPHAGARARRPMSHRLGFRKRPALVAASSLAVVTLSTVLVVNLGGGDFPDDRPSGASHTRSAASRASHGPTVASPSSSPSARPSRSSASQTPKARPSTSVSGGATVAPDRAENTTPDRGPAPLTVSVRAHAWKSPCDASYLVDRPPTEVPQPPLAQDAQGWAGEVGAVPAGEQRVALTVQGTGEQAVVIESLYVRVVDSEAPLAWNAYDMGDGCGGGVATRPFEVDLDAARPTVVPRKGQRGFPYSVSRSDPEVLSITAHTGSRYVRWYLELQWSSGGRQGTMQISDQSEPFRTSAMTGRPRYGYPIGGTAWFKREE